MPLTDWQGAAAVYLPLTVAMILGLLNRNRARQFAGCLLSLLWVAPALLAVQAINLRTGWWSFTGDSVRFRGMPIECFAGWALLWGIVPQLVLPRLGVRGLAALIVAADVIAMPLCRPLVLLGPHWLVGEAFAAFVVLAPALLIAEWTMSGTHLKVRAAFQAMTAALLFLYFVPEVAFALRPGDGWAAFFMLPSWLRQIVIQVVLLSAIPGLSAVMEFATNGDGTPIPYDPPRRLVASGIYRYCANPMQLSCAAVMLVWAGLLQNGWLALAAIVSAIYSAGIAEWNEREDLVRRFGNEWRQYRAAVHNWRLRWKPYHSGPKAHIYIAASCGPCSEMRAWLEARCPVGLKIIDAEELPTGTIRRMRYNAGDGGSRVEGVRAMGRVMEHLNFGWAFAGFVLRLPGIWQVVQLLMDASGLGPRIVAGRQGTESAPDWRQNSSEPDLDKH
jgi:protein-S-isoprenylcysteine O-methyltransferase Ste14